MTVLEKRIESTLRKHLYGGFDVKVEGNKLTISATNYSADQLWDEISASEMFGEEASGWMTAHAENVTLHLDKTNLLK